MSASKDCESSVQGPSMAKKGLDASKLISPPEAERYDSFDARSSVPESTVKESQPEPELRSPPITPEVQKVDPTVQGTQDPILFPASTDTTASALQSRPLFPGNEVAHPNPATTTPLLFKRVPAPPNHNPQQPAVHMVSSLMQHFKRDPRGYLELRKAELKEQNECIRAARESRLYPSTLKPVSSIPARRNSTHRSPREQVPSLLSVKTSPHRDHRALLQPALDSDNRVTKRAARTPSISRANRPTHIAPQLNGAPRHASNSSQGGKRAPGSSPEPRVRTSAPNREDKDFKALPDYCPSLSTLPERTNNLKVDWKGTPLDLSGDPFVGLLHRDEVVLAASLRLDCATYLTSKRRIFIRRLECARMPKEFRKTDAQQACKIDVNKASKLWTAYEKVGWLKIDHIRRFI
ncbi:hypothetical protein Sste5346_007060 [Sporothrix stenoceras]|uniref:SWIRM domain-containing protein n=1 Tax=Sporothrix stenoceras TaxID=5173 RepID=A0ABR3YW97_9PEZI